MADVRRITKSGGGSSLNLPPAAMRALGLRRGDYVIVEVLDEAIQIHKLNTTRGRAWGSKSDPVSR